MLDFFGGGLALSFPFGKTHGVLSSQMSTKEPSASWGGRASQDSRGMGQLSWGQ